MCQSALSVPLTNTSNRPSGFLTTAKRSLLICPPREAHPLQPLFGAVCQMCQRAPSVPRAKTSIRPSWLLIATLRPVITPPSEAQPLHPLLGAVCHKCQSAPSVPRVKTSNRPSRLRTELNPPVITPPMLTHVGSPLGIMQALSRSDQYDWTMTPFKRAALQQASPISFQFEEFDGFICIPSPSGSLHASTNSCEKMVVTESKVPLFITQQYQARSQSNGKS